ncbi:hypothetical protein DLAC_01986 [Tieghemostelium lacteum]|uniref:Kelch repeat-containing protein n=1 Tax=Tieghemostelium lacteum TaxID=361077 RepID=A0A152A5Q2_TIELA|nr:hypothetical protein DLAC_01986 [Tieghemostelium lacteum]|eukprot:KYR01397.1 hypothetical protein DLAC_01986 [Tieghemostelium lacteum]
MVAIIDKEEDFHNKIKCRQTKNFKEKCKIQETIKEIVNNYNQQLVVISVEFEKLYKRLVEKEQELKDELIRDHEATLNQFQDQLEIIQLDMDNCDKVLEGGVSDLADKDWVETDQEFYEIYYEYPMFQSLDLLGSAIDAQKLTKMDRVLNSRDRNTLYRYNRYTGVHMHNIQTNESELLVSKDATDLPIHLGFFYQTHPCAGKLHVFNEESFFVLNTNEKNPKWNSGPFLINDGTSAQSCISDGKDCIYISGGTNVRYVNRGSVSYIDNDINGQSGKKIYRFTISSQTFDYIADLPLASRYHSLTFHEGYLYIIGGLNDHDGYLNKIDRFNVNTREFENILPCIEEKSSYNHISSGFYDNTTKSIFYLSSEKHFSRFNMMDKSIETLKYPLDRNIGHFISKLYFDQFSNLAYLIVHEEKSIYQYNIKENTWKPIKDIFQTMICYNDYISFN